MRTMQDIFQNVTKKYYLLPVNQVFATEFTLTEERKEELIAFGKSVQGHFEKWCY